MSPGIDSRMVDVETMSSYICSAEAPGLSASEKRSVGGVGKTSCGLYGGLRVTTDGSIL